MKDWQKIEAVLFGSGKYLTEEQIMNLTGIPKNKLKKALNDLKKHYETIDTSLKVFNEANTWKLNVKEEYNDIMKNVVSDAEMPKPVMETLAMIAYKAPVLQADIIDVRGSGAYDHINLLEEKGFIEKEKYGRTYKLKLAEKFYDYFDIEGPSEIQKVFGDVKKPELMGELQVYDVDEKDDTFTEKITERLQKLEKTDEEEKQKEEFLDEFEKKITASKNRIDEAEKELSEFKREEIERSEQKTDEILDGEEKNNKKDDKDKEIRNYEDLSTEEMLKKIEADIEKISNNDDEIKDS